MPEIPEPALKIKISRRAGRINMISVIKSRGMTLIEVLVATTLLGVGVTALLSAATLGLRNQQRSELRAMALCVAQEKLSEIELIGPHVWLLARPSSGDTE